MKKTSEIIKSWIVIDEKDSKETMLLKVKKAIIDLAPILYINSSGNLKDLNLFLEINKLIKCNNLSLYILNNVTLAKISCADGVVFDEIPDSLSDIETFLGSHIDIIIIIKDEVVPAFEEDEFSEEKNTKIDTPWKDEFSLIGKLLQLTEKSDFYVNPGEDDCSFLKSIEKPVITTDTQKEDVHFRRKWQSAFEIGAKAVSVTLSDLAASFAEPKALFINLSLPETLSEEYITELYKGVNDSLKKYKCVLGGGNISKGKEFSIDLFAVGNLISDVYPKRGNASLGDLLCTTGPLGEAKAGLEILQNGSDENNLSKKFKNPRARFDIINLLIENGVKCVTDISDGLCGDALHIAKASNLSVKFIKDWIYVSEDLLNYSSSREKALEYVFSGGEDYELLFTCSEESFRIISKKNDRVNKLGVIVEKEKDLLLDLPPGISSFNHGKI